MNPNIIVSTHHTGRDHGAREYLRQEIAFFETRLNAMGDQGDCAYERALSEAYHTMLRERRQQLASLQG